MKISKIFPAITASLFISIMVPAQQLPPLPVDPKITTGKLRCGVTYYIIENSTEKGFADIAIVRKGDALDRGVRAMLDSLVNFSSVTPYRFLSKNGIGYRREGYFSQDGPVTVFRFDKVPTYNMQIADSTLLLSFNLIAESLTDQAVIMSGDLDPEDIAGKMDIFSLTLLPRFYPDVTEEPAWTPTQEARIAFTPSDKKEIASVTADYAAPRIAPDQLNTAQPLVTANFSSEFERIVRKRLTRSLRSRKIPCGGIGYEYISSARTRGPERFRITVTTDSSSLRAATAALAETLAGIDSGFVSVEEYREAVAALAVPMLQIENRTAYPNRCYVEKCISAFLYGSDLAPFRMRTEYFSKNTLDAETRLQLFNSIASALLDRSANLTLSYTAAPGSLTGWDARAVFAEAWRADREARESAPAASEREKIPRAKLKKEGEEPVSGGQVWIFANGSQAIYKRMDSPGTFSFSLFFKGGYSSMPDLQPGEGGFFSGLLGLYGAEGFTPVVHDSGISLEGAARSSDLEAVLRSLIRFIDLRAIEPETAERYLHEERLRLAGADDTERRVYDIMFPRFVLTPYKEADRLTPELMQKADRFFRERLSAGALLILCGDLEEESLRKVLPRYMAAFPGEKAVLARSSLQYQPRSGWTTSTVEGPGQSIRILLSAPVPYTTKNYLAARMALCALRKMLVAALPEEGLAIEVKGGFITHPQERLNVTILCRAASADGLPASVPAPDVTQAISAVRAAIDAAARSLIDPVDVEGFRASVSHAVALEQADPSTVVQTVVTRFADGKDLVTRYEDLLKAVTPEDLRTLIEGLAKGPRVEYIVK